MVDGFDFKELSDFEKDLLKLANDTMPKETRKFLNKQGGELLKEVKKVANKKVKKGNKKVKTFKGKAVLDRKGKEIYLNYHKRWKKGKFIMMKEICLHGLIILLLMGIG